MSENKGVANLEVSLDLETLDLVGSKKRLPTILSIGAAAFDPNMLNTPESFYGGKPEDFEERIKTGLPFANYTVYYTPVSLMQSMRYGFTHGADTVKWWEKQSYNMVAQAASYTDKLLETFKDFATWLKHVNPKKVWANAPTFDISIMREAFDHVGLELEIDFRAERDVRTAIDFAQIEWVKMPPYFVKHHALCDAIHEAIMMQTMYQRRDQLLTAERENEMLKQRIEELNAQISSLKQFNG